MALTFGKKNSAAPPYSHTGSPQATNALWRSLRYRTRLQCAFGFAHLLFRGGDSYGKSSNQMSCLLRNTVQKYKNSANMRRKETKILNFRAIHKYFLFGIRLWACNVIRERTPLWMQTRNVMHRCRAVVPILDCSATAHRRGILFSASEKPEKVIALSIADASAIMRTISL